MDDSSTFDSTAFELGGSELCGSEAGGSELGSSEAVPSEAGPSDRLADSLSMAFLVLFEELAPAERATFLLREVFGYEYKDIGRMLDRNEPACRQLVSRARRRIGDRRKRSTPTANRAESSRGGSSLRVPAAM